ncbi:hypothetical protein DVJ83_03395 [Deinococcus wulumuqiensis]|uniref:Uncharacterized protein n=1 Tax=Deinococcus wulumuqiensis TaxID=980427 RepID=A0A345IF93_9DEIO|nr:hypothetical protein DVJ83_03395 [Deinococcus wulumuqiensis]
MSAQSHTVLRRWTGIRRLSGCSGIGLKPYFFLLASALLRSFASRIECETTRFNRNPYHTTLKNGLDARSIFRSSVSHAARVLRSRPSPSARSHVSPRQVPRHGRAA